MLNLNSLFSDDKLMELFSPNTADNFFEALYGDASEGAYDIELKYRGLSGERLQFEFQLTQRRGKCIACNLTYGLPEVFSKHPIINVRGLVSKIESFLAGHARCIGWNIGQTYEISTTVHAVPLILDLEMGK